MENTTFPILEEKENEIIVKSPCREYKFQNSCFPTSIKSLGQEILNSPIRIVCEANGEKEIFEPAENFTVDYKDDAVTVVAAMQSKVFFVNTTVNVEEDGCAFVGLSIMPRGLSVPQLYGLEPKTFYNRVIDKLWLEIPFKKECATYYNIAPNTRLYVDIEYRDLAKGEPWAISWSGMTPENGFSSPFTSQIMLANDDIGLGFFFYSDEHWNIKDKTKAFEVIENGDEYILRIHILDGESDVWQGRTTENQSINLDPITFKFGFCATPYREIDTFPFTEKAMHIDCFKKVAENYEDFLSKPVCDGDDEIGFDRLKRLGVEVLYIHEKWNDMQNSPLLTNKTKKRAKYIIEECHKRGIKVVPYFGMEISSLSPYFTDYGEDWKVKSYQDKVMLSGSWNRWPAQRALKVCLNSGWADVLINGIVKVIEEFGFDGIYLDSTMKVRPCTNFNHGCGFKDADGVWHTTYQQEGIRKVFKALYKYTSERGLIMNSHCGGAMNLVALGYCTSIWEGETIQDPLLHGVISKMPEGHMRMAFGSKHYGMPIYSLCYSNDPVWTYHSAVTIGLLHNSMPRPVDIGTPLEETSALWKVYDSFPIECSKWKPYYSNNGIATSDNRVKVSYYDAGDELLAVVAGTEKGIEKEVIIDFTHLNSVTITDAFSGETVSENGVYQTYIKGFEYRLLRIK